MHTELLGDTAWMRRRLQMSCNECRLEVDAHVKFMQLARARARNWHMERHAWLRLTHGIMRRSVAPPVERRPWRTKAGNWLIH